MVNPTTDESASAGIRNSPEDSGGAADTKGGCAVEQVRHVDDGSTGWTSPSLNGAQQTGLFGARFVV